MHQEAFSRDPLSFCERSWISCISTRTWSRWRGLYQDGWACTKRFQTSYEASRILSILKELVDLSQWWQNIWTIEKSIRLQRGVVHITPSTPRIWKYQYWHQSSSSSSIWWQWSDSNEFPHMSVLTKLFDRKEIFGSNVRRATFTFFLVLLQLDCLHLTAGYCNRRVCKYYTSNDVVAVQTSASSNVSQGNLPNSLSKAQCNAQFVAQRCLGVDPRRRTAGWWWLQLLKVQRHNQRRVQQFGWWRLRTSPTSNASRCWQADQIGTEPLRTWTRAERSFWRQITRWWTGTRNALEPRVNILDMFES